MDADGAGFVPAGVIVTWRGRSRVLTSAAAGLGFPAQNIADTSGCNLGGACVDDQGESNGLTAVMQCAVLYTATEPPAKQSDIR